MNCLLSIILDFKWHILLISEIVGWTLTAFLVFSRYYLQSKIFTWLSVILLAILDYLPAIVLPIMDAIYINDFKEWLYNGGLLFNLSIIGLFIISIILGKKYLIIIDQKIMNYVNSIKLKQSKETV